MAKVKLLQLKRLDQLVAASLALVVVANLVIESEARYMPRMPSMQRREAYENDEDSDGDPDRDQDTSASYQNQDDNSQPGSDGYEDTEADGPYGETPREEEGQADLERFFDDHLGASEKDGMDKENLPTNLVPLVAIGPQRVRRPPVSPLDLQVASSQLEISLSDEQQPATGGEDSGKQYQMDEGNEQNQRRQASRVKTNYVRLPEHNRLIITRQITSDPSGSGAFSPSRRVVVVPGYGGDGQSGPQPRASEADALLANSSEVVLAEDEDMDKVYVTNMKNKRFKIPALGGYDPEEDFKYASRDIEKVERPPMTTSSSTRRRGSRHPRRDARKSRQDPEADEDQAPPHKDISFNDPEDEQLYNDASELDEVTFGPDEMDLEEEMRRQQYDKVGKVGLGQRTREADGARLESNDQEPIRRRPPPPITRRDSYEDPDDNDESTWINDGADEMEIPSQSHQDFVLEKAAKQEALAKKAAEEADRQAQAEAEAAEAEAAEASASAPGGENNEAPSPAADEEEENSQRMPSAAYLNNDLKMDDTDYNN